MEPPEGATVGVPIGSQVGGTNDVVGGDIGVAIGKPPTPPTPFPAGTGPLVVVDIWHPDAVKHTHSAVTIATFLIPRFSHMGTEYTGAIGGITGV